jgi:hypothetical protein
MSIHFFSRGEPYPFFNDRAFQNSNCSERRSFQIMRFWQMIGKWLGITYRDWCGGVNLMFSVIKLEISQKIMSISRSTADNFKNVQSFACNLTSFESKVLSKALGVNIGKRTESHRTKSRKSPKTKSHRTESHNLYFLPWRTKSHRTKHHNLYFCM